MVSHLISNKVYNLLTNNIIRIWLFITATNVLKQSGQRSCIHNYTIIIRKNPKCNSNYECPESIKYVLG